MEVNNMSNIDLRKFVDINIQKHVDSVIVGTRDTVVLFTDYGSKGTTHILSNMQAANNIYLGRSDTEDLLAYLKLYFDNGGCKVIVYEGYQTVTKDDLKTLPDEYICVASTSMSYSALVALAESMNDDSSIYGIKEKLIFARTTLVDDALSTKNFVVKYSNVIGAEMTMMAYLSSIDTYGIDTVFDYAFTQETLSKEDVSDANFDILMANNINVNIRLANASRVCGGNCKDGVELTNNFVRIVLHQTLTEQLVLLLTQKLRSNSGLGKIYTVIAQEMSKYLSCGYLTTDKVWSDDNLTVTVNGHSYTIVEKGTALINGYIVKVLPLESLSDADKAAHKAPLIYIVVADQYAIRKITINGEII